MQKTWWLAAVAIFLAGCATYGPQSMVRAGNYAAAYSLAINDAQLSKERKDIADSILQATGGAKGDVYFRSVQSSIQHENYKNREFFLQTLRHITAAPSDGLLSTAQAEVLRKELRDAVENAITDDPQLLESDELLTAFGLSRDRMAITERTLDRLINASTTDLEKFFPLYTIFRTGNDAARMERTKSAMQTVITKNLASLKDQTVSYSVISVYVNYAKLTGDRTFDTRIQEALARANLSRQNLTAIGEVFPEFAQNNLSSRQIKIDLKTNGDEFLMGEISDALKLVNEWIEIDPEANRKINLVRLRLNEQRSQPINNTEVVPDPDFGTLLMMPKNASAMIDYTSSEYSLQWNFTVQDPLTKKSKPITGAQRLKKIECRNIRYQNVFGGVGPLYNFPNARVQAACEDGARVDFDKARADVVRQIAQEINDNFLAPK